MSDDTRHIIALTGTVGELKGKVEALVNGLENFTKEMRKANGDQWEAIGDSKDDCAKRTQKVVKDLSDHRVSDSMRTAGISGGTTSSLVLAWEIVKHYFKGGS